MMLIDDVHRQLGRHRPDDARSGWISGLSEAEGARHPTCGGLRIGKPLPERLPDEDFDPELEWERDGQYLHYLTRWMHALRQAARVCECPRLLDWARELAATAFRAFRFETAPGRQGLYWKMSIDLSRPLVSSMGQHDPLDAYLTSLELAQPAMENEIAWLARLVEGGRWVTDDPLGLGGLMVDADRAFQIETRGDKRVAGLALDLVGAVREGLEMLVERAPWREPLQEPEMGASPLKLVCTSFHGVLASAPDLRTLSCGAWRLHSSIIHESSSRIVRLVGSVGSEAWSRPTQPTQKAGRTHVYH